MRAFGYIMAALLILGLFVAIGLGTDYGGMLWQRFIAPQKEAVRREVFKETRSYNEGKEQELTKYRYEYLMAKSEQDRMAIAGTIRLSFADYPEDKLDSTILRSFLKQIKAGVLPATQPAWKGTGQ